MAAPRLPQIWPSLRRCSCDVYNPALRSARAAQRIRAYHPSAGRHQQEQIPQRYGTANEPPPHLGGGKSIGPSTTKSASEAGEGEKKALPKIGERLQRDGEAEVDRAGGQQEQSPESGGSQEAKKEPTTIDGKTTAQMVDPMLDSSEALPTAAPPGSPLMPDENPLESVLQSVPAQDYQRKQDTTNSHPEEHPDKSYDEHSPPVKAPHMEAPRYIHHFDTYGLVKRLENGGGWRQDQAITIMKAALTITIIEAASIETRLTGVKFL